MWWILLTGMVRADNYAYPIVLTGGIGAGSSVSRNAFSGSNGAGVSGHAIFQLPALAVDLGYQEFYYGGNDQNIGDRMIGGIFMGMRHWIRPNGIYMREGLYHQHETPMGILQSRPVAATLGAAEGINHRTGLGVGWGILQPQPASWLPLSAGLDVGAQYFWDGDQPTYYLSVELTFGLNLGSQNGVIGIQ